MRRRVFITRRDCPAFPMQNCSFSAGVVRLQIDPAKGILGNYGENVNVSG
jgi:hypothetical protein